MQCLNFLIETTPAKIYKNDTVAQICGPELVAW